MSLKHPACCRAVQRTLLSTGDFLWCPDIALSNAFERFYALSHTARRYGSSVPGPMECRRRMGKRRMTYQTEALPASSLPLATLWGSSGAPDMTQWQYEAPKSRPETQQTSTTALPAWLADWDKNQQGLSPAVTELEPSQVEKTRTFEDDLEELRAGIEREHGKMRKDPSELKISSLFGSFHQSLKQNLTLGLVSEEQLLSMLQLVPQDVQLFLRSNRDPKHRDKYKALLDLGRRLMTTFYQTIWDGMKACKVLRPVDISGNVMRTFLLSAVPYSGTKAVQDVVRDMIGSLSFSQLLEMRPGLNKFVKAWSITWSDEQPSNDIAAYIAVAEQSIKEIQLTLETAHKETMAMKESVSANDLAIARNVLADIRGLISGGINSIVEADNAANPWMVSVEDLASFLDSLPPEIATEITRSCFGRKAREEAAWRSFRYRWLYMMSKMSSVHDELFVEVWLGMEKWGAQNSFYPLNAQESSYLVLSRWTNQTYFQQSAVVRNTFEASMRWSGMGDFGLLIRSIDIHREKHWEKTKALFDLLVKLNKDNLIPSVLQRLLSLSLKYKPSVFNPILETLSERNPRLAWKIFQVFETASYSRKPYGIYRLEYCPKLVVALIRDPSFNTNELWRTLGIPFFQSLGPRHGIFGPTNKVIHHKKIDLIHLMATEISCCTWRSRGARLRGVMQCGWYLRYNRVPLSPQLTQAFCRASITRDIIEDRWVNTERARWVLELIAWAEGKQVAESAADTTALWQAHMQANLALEKKRTRSPISMYGEI